MSAVSILASAGSRVDVVVPNELATVNASDLVIRQSVALVHSLEAVHGENVERKLVWVSGEHSNVLSVGVLASGACHCHELALHPYRLQGEEQSEEDRLHV